MLRYRFLLTMFVFAALVVTPIAHAPAAEPVAAAVVGAATEGVAPVSLRPRFVAGQKSRFEIWTLKQTHDSVSVNGHAQQNNTSMEINGEVLWEVERVGNDGAATCVMTVDWLTATMELADGSVVEVDSRRPAKAAAAGDDADNVESTVGQVIRSMSAVPLKVKMGADGSVLGVTGVDAVRRKLGNGPKPPDELDFMETAADLATVVAAPPTSVAGGPGGKWDASLTWNHEVGKLQEQMTYTLGGTEEVAGIPIATVLGSAKVKLVPDVAKVQAQLPAGTPRPEIRFTGGSFDTQILIDLTRGEAVGRNTVQRVGFEMRAKIGNAAVIRAIDETIQSQALRIWED